MKIGIVGGGVIGGATARAFAGFVDEVRVHDVRPERATHKLSQVLECDLIFICLPTPRKLESLECDTSAVEKFVGLTGPIDRCRNFVLRSTVPIGTTRRLREQYNLPNLIHSPEFLTARTATLDAMMPTRNIVGGGRFVKAGSCADMLASLYVRRFPGVPIYHLTSDESEAVKLFQNAFSAVKIACFNEFRCLADKLGLDWGNCLEALLAGGWINPMHTQVPGPDGKRGFGGACLPKDLDNLIECCEQAGVGHQVIWAAHERNGEDRKR